MAKIKLYPEFTIPVNSGGQKQFHHGDLLISYELIYFSDTKEYETTTLSIKVITEDSIGKKVTTDNLMPFLDFMDNDEFESTRIETAVASNAEWVIATEITNEKAIVRCDNTPLLADFPTVFETLGSLFNPAIAVNH